MFASADIRARCVVGGALMRRTVLTVLFGLLGVCPAMAIEEPGYEVVRKADGYELRRYAGYCVAETEVAGSRTDAGNAGFRVLAKYIFGANQSQQSIAMTAPVVQAPSETIAMTAPVTQQPGAAPGTYVVQFTMPSAYTLQTLPKPNDARVRLRQLPDRLVAVRAYGGGWSFSRYETELAALREAMQRDGLIASSAPQWARYNSPFSLPFMRRNEIWLEIDLQ
jgi:SOUL heme-binding protein